MRRLGVSLTVLACCLALAAPAGAGTAFVLRGHGWGHGIGMSQYGALGYARHGWGYERILAHYYPGTTLSTSAPTAVRVLLVQDAKGVRIGSEAPFRATGADGKRVRVPAGTARVGPHLTFAGTRLEGPVTLRPGSAALRVGGVRYRGTLRISSAGRRVSVVNRVGLEQYLRGVVPREMPDDWEQQALRAQAVAARSYALVGLHPGSDFDVYADTRSQVYGGMEAEDPATDEAVAATARKVLTYGGSVAHTFFFSTSGGRTAAIGDVWPEAQRLPYLASVDDPYDTLSPYHDWTAVVTDGQLAGRFGATLPTTLSVRPGASGRNDAVLVGGTAVAASTFQARTHLRSTWFSVDGSASLDPTGPLKGYGEPVTLAGSVSGLEPPALQSRTPGAPWQEAAAVQPAGDGSFRVTVTPQGPTSYRLAGDGWTGPAVRLSLEHVRAPRPADVPRAIPRWAWQVLAWQRAAPAERGPRPAAAPNRLPRWYWQWRAWISAG